MGNGDLLPAVDRAGFLCHSVSLQMKKGAALATPCGLFDTGALFEGTGVIYMKAPFFPGRALPDERQIFGETKKRPF